MITVVTSPHYFFVLNASPHLSKIVILLLFCYNRFYFVSNMDADDSEEPVLKKRKRHSNSRGAYRFFLPSRFHSSAVPPPTSSSSKASAIKQDPETELEIMTWITNCGQCCGKVQEQASCCLLQQLKRSTGEYRFQVSLLVVY